MLARLRWCCVFFVHSQGDAVITLMMGLCQCVLADTLMYQKKHSDKQTSRRSDLILDLLSNVPVGTASHETIRQRKQSHWIGESNGFRRADTTTPPRLSAFCREHVFRMTPQRMRTSCSCMRLRVSWLRFFVCVGRAGATLQS